MRTRSTTYFQHASCVKNALPVNYINVKHIKPHVVLHIGTENLIARSIFFFWPLYLFSPIPLIQSFHSVLSDFSFSIRSISVLIMTISPAPSVTSSLSVSE